MIGGREKFGQSARVGALVALAMALLQTEAAMASPWNAAPGSGILITRSEFFRADLEPVNTIDGLADGRFQRIATDAYFEIGVSDRLMIGGKAIYAFTQFERGRERRDRSGFSEFGGFVQWQAYRDADQAVALLIGLRDPGGIDSGVRPGFESGGVDLDLRALYGRDIRAANPKIFAAADAGYRRRFSDSADQAVGQFTLGVEPSEKLLILTETFHKVALGRAVNDGVAFDIHALQASLVYRFSDHWSLQAGAYKEVDGRNIALGQSAFVSIWTTF